MLLQPPEYLVSTCQCMGLTRKVGLFVVISAPYNLFQYHIMCSFLMHYVALSALLCIVFSFRTPLRGQTSVYSIFSPHKPAQIKDSFTITNTIYHQEAVAPAFVRAQLSQACGERDVFRWMNNIGLN